MTNAHAYYYNKPRIGPHAYGDILEVINEFL